MLGSSEECFNDPGSAYIAEKAFRQYDGQVHLSNEVVLNAVGRRNTQMRTMKRKRRNVPCAQHINFGRHHLPRKTHPKTPIRNPQNEFPGSALSFLYYLIGHPEFPGIFRHFPGEVFGVPKNRIFGGRWSWYVGTAVTEMTILINLRFGAGWGGRKFTEDCPKTESPRRGFCRHGHPNSASLLSHPIWTDTTLQGSTCKSAFESCNSVPCIAKPPESVTSYKDRYVCWQCISSVKRKSPTFLPDNPFHMN